MQPPTISQYIATVTEPAGLARTLGDFRAERDNYGEVRVRSGNNACAFRIECRGKDLMLKCYMRPRPDLRDIYRYISRSGDPLFPRVRYLPDELYVFDTFGRGRYFDVLVAPWQQGVTLDTEIKRCCREGDRKRLEVISASFDNLAGQLLSRPWAHGDLKPENIVVAPDGTMTLIDFDALYYPDNSAMANPEVGTPGYQHPLRDESFCDKCVDDYPAALISASLRALSLEPSLYPEYNRSDIIVINPSEVLDGTSAAYPRVLELLARAGCFGHYRLAMMLGGTSVKIEGIGGVFDRICKPVNIPDTCEEMFEGGYFGYADGDTGRILIEPVFEEAFPFREGTALVSVRGEKKIITRNGKYLFPDLAFENIKSLSEGLAAFCKAGKWGYVAADGAVAVLPRYDGAGSFHDGIAPVCKDGRWGYIDTCGECLTGFIFDKALGCRNGIAEAFIAGRPVKIELKNILKSPK